MTHRGRTSARTAPKGAAHRPSASGPSHEALGVSVSERRAALALFALALLGLVGTVGTTTQAQSVDVAALIAGIAAVVAAIVWFALRGGSRVPFRVALAGGAFLAVAGVSAIASGRGFSAFMGEPTGLLGWGALAVLAVLASAAARSTDAIRAVFARWAWIAVALEALLAAGQLALGKLPNGTLANSTYLGEAILLLLPWTLLDDARRPRAEQWLRTSTALLAVGVLAGAGARVAAIAGTLWLVWAFSRRTTLSRRNRALLSGGVIALVALAALLFARAETLGSLSRSTLGVRPQLWRLAADAVADRPLLGWGPDGFVAGGAHASTLARASATTLPILRPGATDPHSLLVWVAVSAGLLGFAAFAWLFVELARAWSRAVRAHDASTPAIFALVLVSAVFLTAPVTLHVVPLLGVTLGMAIARHRFAPAEDGPAPAWRTAPASRALPLVLAFLLGLAGALVAVDAATRTTYEAYGASTTPRAAASAVSAARILSFDPYLSYLASMNAGYAAASDPSIAVRRDDLVALDRAVALDRRDPFSALERARTLRAYGADVEQTRAAFEEALRRYPYYPLAHAECAAYLAGQGASAEARAHLAIAKGVADQDPARLAAIAAAERLLAASKP